MAFLNPLTPGNAVTLPPDFIPGFVGSSGIAGVNINAKTNPDFAPQTQYSSVHQGGHRASNPLLGKGYMISTVPDNEVTLKFLFNPTKYVVDYSMNPSLIPPIFQSSEMGTIPNIFNGMNISFNLLLDRTIECWHDENYPGILVDIAVLEKLVGVNDNGTISSYPVKIFFGRHGASPKFAGVVTSLSVDMMLYNKFMIPTQAMAALSVQQTYVSSNDSTAAGGTTSSDPPTIGFGGSNLLPGSSNSQPAPAPTTRQVHPPRKVS